MKHHFPKAAVAAALVAGLALAGCKKNDTTDTDAMGTTPPAAAPAPAMPPAATYPAATTYPGAATYPGAMTSPAATDYSGATAPPQ